MVLWITHKLFTKKNSIRWSEKLIFDIHLQYCLQPLSDFSARLSQIESQDKVVLLNFQEVYPVQKKQK